MALQLPKQSQRKVKELFGPIIDLHSKWIDLSSVGSQSANELVNIFIQMQQIENNENFGIFQDDEELKNAVKHKLEVQAQIKLSSLNATHEDLCTYYKKAKVALEQLEAFYWQLVEQNILLANTVPIFKTASMQSWIIWANEILSMYTQDLLMKKLVMDDLPKTPASSRNTLTVYLSCWLTSPLVNPSKLSNITSMISAEMEQADEEEKLISTPKNSKSNPDSKSSGKSKKTPQSKTPSQTPSPRTKR